MLLIRYDWPGRPVAVLEGTFPFLCTSSFDSWLWLKELVPHTIRIIQLYEVKKKSTMPHGLVMGVWLLMFVVLLLNVELLTLAPQYTTFGNQHVVWRCFPLDLV